MLEFAKCLVKLEATICSITLHHFVSYTSEGDRAAICSLFENGRHLLPSRYEEVYLKQVIFERSLGQWGQVLHEAPAGLWA